MIMLSKRLSSLKRQVIATAGIALSLAVLTAEPVDASSFNLHFSRKGNEIGIGSFSVDDDGNIIGFRSTNSFVQGRIFTEKNIRRGAFDIETNQFKNFKLKNGVTLKLNKNRWRLKSNGNLIEKGKYEVTNKEAKPVPEPLTILGSVTALGIGGLLKKQHSRKLKKQELA